MASVSCIYGLGAPELYLQMTEEISIELTKEHIKKIKSKNDDLNAFVLLTEDLALERAAKADLRIQDKKNINKLTGIPYAAKDLYCTNGVRTTACSKALFRYDRPQKGRFRTAFNFACNIYKKITYLIDAGMRQLLSTGYMHNRVKTKSDKPRA